MWAWCDGEIAWVPLFLPLAFDVDTPGLEIPMLSMYPFRLSSALPSLLFKNENTGTGWEHTDLIISSSELFIFRIIFEVPGVV